MVLHTWTRDLLFHPHVHAIVSAGAWASNTWVPSRADYLFPAKVMARLFRRLFREHLLRAIDRGDVRVRPDVAPPMRRALFQTKWVVYAKAPFGGAEQVYSYLGRYTHRVGIANSRIRHADDHAVTFATKNGRTRTFLAACPTQGLAQDQALRAVLQSPHRRQHVGEGARAARTELGDVYHSCCTATGRRHRPSERSNTPELG